MAKTQNTVISETCQFHRLEYVIRIPACGIRVTYMYMLYAFHKLYILRHQLIDSTKQTKNMYEKTTE